MSASGLLEQAREERRLHDLASLHAEFATAWRPKDPIEARDFDRGLNYLMHSIYRAAQEPLTKQLTDFVMATAPSIRIGAKE